MGIAFKVKSAWIGVGGKAKLFWPPGQKLSTLPLGSRVLFEGLYYTVVGQSICVSGDTILWAETASSKKSTVLSTTPFGAGNTNNVTITYNTYEYYGTDLEYSRTITTTSTGYGWLIPGKSLNHNMLTGSSRAGLPDLPYFDTNTNTRRKRVTKYRCPDRCADGEGSYYDYWINADGSYSYGSVGTIDYYHAYSVKGDLVAKPNSDGTYTLQI